MVIIRIENDLRTIKYSKSERNFVQNLCNMYREKYNTDTVGATWGVSGNNDNYYEILCGEQFFINCNKKVGTFPGNTGTQG